jgi:O-antigen/teichoic acid export membrane protein
MIAAAVTATVIAVVGTYFAIIFVIAAFAHWVKALPGKAAVPVSTVRFRSGWPYAVSAATYTLYFTADAAIIAATRSSQEVGQYKAAYMLITAATVLPVVLNNDMLRARLANLHHSPAQSWAVIRRLAGANVVLGSALTVGVCLLGPPLAGFIYGPEFERAASLLSILGLALLPYALSTFSANALIALNRVRLVLAVQVLLCVANVGSNALLVPTYGLDAAAYVTVGTELVGAVSFGAVLASRRRASSALRDSAAATQTPQS